MAKRITNKELQDEIRALAMQVKAIVKAITNAATEARKRDINLREALHRNTELTHALNVSVKTNGADIVSNHEYLMNHFIGSETLEDIADIQNICKHKWGEPSVVRVNKDNFVGRVVCLKCSLVEQQSVPSKLRQWFLPQTIGDAVDWTYDMAVEYYQKKKFRELK